MKKGPPPKGKARKEPSSEWCIKGEIMVHIAPLVERNSLHRYIMFFNQLPGVILGNQDTPAIIVRLQPIGDFAIR